MISRLFILLLLLLLLLPLLSLAQFTMRGKVLDASTKTELPGANVFVSNTTSSALSDGNGRFRLAVPVGQYQVLVSFVGYQSIIVNAETLKDPNKEYVFELQPDVNQLKAVKVISAKERARYMRIFFNALIGSGDTSKKTKILNPEQIEFDFDAASQTLYAYADEPLQIENSALNYHITFVLAEFAANLDKETSIYIGYPHFREIINEKTGPRQSRRNRKKAYNGSAMHFVRAAFNNQICESGFRIRNVRIELANPKYALANAADKSFHQEQYNFICLGHDLVSEHFVRSENDRKFLSFKNYLELYYKEPHDSAYQPKQKLGDYQVTQLKLADNDIEIFKDGSFSPADGLIFHGYLGWEKLSDMLPFDYIPPDQYTAK